MEQLPPDSSRQPAQQSGRGLIRGEWFDSGFIKRRSRRFPKTLQQTIRRIIANATVGFASAITSASMPSSPDPEAPPEGIFRLRREG